MKPQHFPEPAMEKIELEFQGFTILAEQVVDLETVWQKLLDLGEDHPWVKDERIPYWAEVWPSAIALSKHLISRKTFLQGKSVLEIGCGLAIPGIVAAKLGAKVVISDYQQDALDLAKHNWMLNHSQEPDCLQLDWRDPHPEMAADILLASDVAYEKRSFEPLIAAFSTLVKPGGTIFISEPGRDFAREFLEKLSAQEYEKKETIIPVTWRKTKFEINVWELRSIK